MLVTSRARAARPEPHPPDHFAPPDIDDDDLGAVFCLDCDRHAVARELDRSHRGAPSHCDVKIRESTPAGRRQLRGPPGDGDDEDDGAGDKQDAHDVDCRLEQPDVAPVKPGGRRLAARPGVRLRLLVHEP